MALAPGTRLGAYEILALLGAGGMGHVYRARDTRLGREVAVKLVAEHLTRDRSAVDRFVREAHAASRLNHPNIVTIHEIGEAEVGRFIVMELVQGRTLREVVTERVAWESLVDLGRQIAKALAAAHSAGIVHRDVKPENVMLRDDGYVKVLDFGLARLLPTQDGAPEVVTASATEAGTVLGTLRYMAPEQARGGRAGPAADVFALGLVLYELTTGRHPFSADPRFGSVDAIVCDPALPPRHLNPEIPGTLEALLLQMLEKDPRRRPTAAEVAALLTQLTGRIPVAQTRRVGGPPQHRSVGREGERAALRAAFDGAATGNGLFVCVAGEPGIGKTTLVEDFLAELEAEGHSRVARGRCSERLAGAEAYLPWLEALEDLLRSASGAELARLMRLVAPSWYAQVAPTDADHEQAPGEPRAASQERIKRELAAFLQEAVRVRPLVLFFDDVHWSDVSTVDLLTYVGTKLSSMRMLIVATYRPSELALSRHPFGSVKLDLQSRGMCRDLPLGFLSRQEVGDYLALEFRGHDFPAEFPGFIHAKTEGSPLFMGGLLHDLRGRGIIAQERGHWSLVRAIPVIERELPESVHSMIQRKIETLVEADRHLLIAAGVQGYEFDSAVVARALERDAAQVEERLDELERVHAFIRRVGEREMPDRTLSVRCRFVHVLYQNVLYGSVPPTRKAALSAAVANALAAHHGDARSEIASELALLFEAARDSERAIEHFLLAARRAAQMFAHQEAIVLSRRALELLRTLPETPERDGRELDLLMTLGPALSLTKGFFAAAVEEIFLRARELCQRAGDTARLFPVLYGLCVFCVTRAKTELPPRAVGPTGCPGQAGARPAASAAGASRGMDDPGRRGRVGHGPRPPPRGYGALRPPEARLSSSFVRGTRSGCVLPGLRRTGSLGARLPGSGSHQSSRSACSGARSCPSVQYREAHFYAAMLHQLRREAPAARDHAHETITLTQDQIFRNSFRTGTSCTDGHWQNSTGPTRACGSSAKAYGPRRRWEIGSFARTGSLC